ncbi:MAG TPA: malate synthase A, partial [Thermoplasmata archaeon]|nr:malate synthase A [Thermoplasmata archaeon]
MTGHVPADSPWADPPATPGAGHPGSSEEARIRRPVAPGSETLFTREATEFLARLARQFRGRREALLAERTRWAEEVRQGVPLEPSPDVQAIRDREWTVPEPAPGLETRSVELLGVPEARTLVRGLNSTADVFVADFEDLLSPTWEGVVRGHSNLVEAVRRSLEYATPDGERFRIARRPATLMVRPRGWHLVELHALVGGEPIPAPLFDFGLYAFHNARDLVRTGTGPYLYLPKLEHQGEAALWREIFEATEGELGLREGTIRASAAIETL